MKKFEFEACLRYAALIDETIKRRTNEIVYACMHTNGDVCIDSAAILQGNQKKITKIKAAIPQMWKYKATKFTPEDTNGILFFKYQGGLIEDRL